MALYTFVKEFHQAEFELKIDTIIQQLSDNDCQRVEFLRGMLSAYKEIIEIRQGLVVVLKFVHFFS